MREKPILFSGPMVRAILEDRKTQTRRVVKLDADGCYDTVTDSGIERVPHTARTIMRDLRCPYEPGDRLWVRETWCPAAKTGYDAPLDGRPGCGDDDSIPFPLWYRATDSGMVDVSGDGGWCPSIHMPRWASRITLEVTEVRVQRVQETSEEDSIAEGVDNDCWIDGKPMSDVWYNYLIDMWDGGLGGPQDSLQTLWDSINGKRPGCSWKDNPWVWAVSFKRVSA